MDNLINFARRFKGFLAFAALLILGLIFVVTYLFSKGSFDTILAGFGNLSADQFLGVVYTVLGLSFLMVFTLILLSYRRTESENPTDVKPQSGLIYVTVHDIRDITKVIPGAEVRLMLPEPRFAETDSSGSAKLTFPAECTERSFAINASKDGYDSGKPLEAKMKHGNTVYIPLKPQKNATEPSTQSPKPSGTVTAGQQGEKGRDMAEDKTKKSLDTPLAPQSVQSTTISNTPTLIGLAVDLSGSMAESMQNNTGGQLTRLETFRLSLEKLIRDTKQAVKHKGQQGFQTTIEVFIYGFGLRGIDVCDILSLIRVGKDVISEEEIEKLKARYIQEARGRYDKYSGLDSLARQYGFGNIVNDIERGVRANAENEIRRRILIEVKSRIEQRLVSVGDTTLSLDELAGLWESSEAAFGNAEELIFGNTPMRLAMEQVKDRFHRELSRRPKETNNTLFLLSDGEPTDGDPQEAATAIRNMGVVILAGYITDRDISNPRILYSEPENHWSRGAKLMFNMASTIQAESDFARFLRGKGWTIQDNAKMFVQINHSDILEEFTNTLLSPITESQSQITLRRGN